MICAYFVLIIIYVYEKKPVNFTDFILLTKIYFVHHGAKIRYIDPLINGERISKINKKAQELINNNLSYNMNKYIYLDFNF